MYSQIIWQVRFDPLGGVLADLKQLLCDEVILLQDQVWVYCLVFYLAWLNFHLPFMHLAHGSPGTHWDFLAGLCRFCIFLLVLFLPQKMIVLDLDFILLFVSSLLSLGCSSINMWMELSTRVWREARDFNDTHPLIISSLQVMHPRSLPVDPNGNSDLFATSVRLVFVLSHLWSAELLGRAVFLQVFAKLIFCHLGGGGDWSRRRGSRRGTGAFRSTLRPAVCSCRVPGVWLCS